MSLNQVVLAYSLDTTWLGPGRGRNEGPGDPGDNMTGGSFQALCLDECGCSPGKISGAPTCTDENCGRYASLSDSISTFLDRFEL